jgi:ribonuclease BN (tRNA processing enzyme)
VNDALRLTVVGCAAAYTLRPWPSSAYLVECGETAILLDIGHGAFAALAAVREPSTLDALFVSHLHPDHNADLVALRHYLKFAQPSARVALHGPAELRPRFDAYLGEDGFLDDMSGDGLEPGQRTVGGLEVEIARVTHTESSFGFRVARTDGGPGVVYSGDCGRVDDLVALLRPGDTLLSEASFGQGEPIAGVPHLTARQAAEAARHGSAQRLILTHLLPEAGPDESVAIARETFSGDVILAEPGVRLSI